MHRRQFIKKGCLLCAGITGAAMAASLLDSCTPLPYFKTTSSEKKIRVPMTEFGKSDFLIAGPTDYHYDIAVIKQPNGDYKSLIMQCTHADNILYFNGKQFNCNLHGSSFNRAGEVLKGPAERNLIELKTERNEGEIIIYLK